jgi:WD40 repeat protein
MGTAGCYGCYGKKQKLYGTVLGALVAGLTLIRCPSVSWAQQPLLVLQGHDEPVYDVAYSADGKWIATCGFDQTVRIWDSGTGQTVRVFRGHAGLVLGVAFSPQGRLLASVGFDRTLKLWELPYPLPLQRWQGHTGPLRSVAVAPDGSVAVSGSADGTVRLWETSSGKVLQTQSVQVPVSAVRFSPNGAFYAAGADDGKLYVWNRGDGKLLGTAEGHRAAILATAVHANSQQVLSAGADSGIKLWLVPFPAERTVAGHEQAVLSLALSADGARVLSGGEDKSLRLHLVSNGAQERVFSGIDDMVTAVAYSLDGQQAAAATRSGHVYVFNATNGQLLGVIRGVHQGEITSASFHPSGQQLLTSSLDGGAKLSKLPLVTPRAHDIPAEPTGLLVLPGRERVVIGGADGKGYVARSGDGAIERAYELHGGAVVALALGAGPSELYTIGADRTLKRSDALSGAVSFQFPLNRDLVSVQVPAVSGGPIAVGTADGCVLLVDPGSAQAEAPYPSAGSAVRLLAVAPQGNWTVAGGGDGKLWAWRPATPQVLSLPEPFSQAVASLIFLREDLVLAAAEDRSLRWWTLGDTPQVRGTLANLPAVATALAVSGDGNRLVAGLSSGHAQVYRVDGQNLGAPLQDPKDVTLQEGQPVVGAAVWNPWALLGTSDGKLHWLQLNSMAIERRIEHGAPLRAVALASDRKTVVTAGDDSKLKLWNVETGQLTVELGPTANPPRAVLVPPSSPFVVAGLADGQIEVWHLDTKQRLTTLRLPGDSRLAWLPDGRVLAASGDAQVRTMRLPRVHHELQAHSGPVRAVLFSPDGQRLYSAGQDQRVRSWETISGKLLAQTEPLGAALTALASSREGNLIFAAGEDGQIRELASSDLKVGRVLATGLKGITALSYTPEGQRLGAGSADGNAVTLDVRTGRPLQLLPTEGPVAAVGFAPDPGNVLVTAGKDRKLRFLTLAVQQVLWASSSPLRAGLILVNGRAVVATDEGAILILDPSTGQEVSRLTGHQGPALCVAATRDGRRLASGGADGTVRLWDTRAGTPLTQIAAHEKAVVAVAFGGDENRLASASEDGVVRTWEWPTGTLLQTFRLGLPLKDVAYLPDNKTLLVAGADKLIRVLTLALDQRYVAHQGPVHALAFHPSGTQFVSGGEDRTIRLWRTADAGLIGQWTGHEGAIWALSFSPNGAMVASGSADGTVRLWNASNGQVLHVWKDLSASVRSVCFSYDNRLVAAGTEAGRLAVWSIAESAVLESFQAGTAVREVGFAPDNRTLLAATDANELFVFRLASLEPRTLTGHGDIVDTVAFSRDSSRVATGSYDRTVRLWNPENGQQLLTIGADATRAVYAVAFSPDGKLLVTAGLDKIIKAFQVDNGQEIRRYSGHTEGVYCLDISPDGQSIASGGPDKTVRLWNLASGLEVQTLSGFAGWVYDVEFVASGKYLVAGDYTGEVTIWDVTNGTKVHSFRIPSVEGRPNAIYHLAINPAGDRLAVASANGNAYVFELPASFR